MFLPFQRRDGRLSDRPVDSPGVIYRNLVPKVGQSVVSIAPLSVWIMNAAPSHFVFTRTLTQTN
jgi:hypothetical protein